MDPRLVFLDEVRPAGVLEGRAGIREAVLEAIDIAGHDRLPCLFQIPSGGFPGDALPLGLHDEVPEAFDFGHRPLHDLLPLCVQESLLEVALQPVHGFEVVRGGRVPGMRPELLELLFVKAERNALLDETGERIDDGIEVSLSREVDLFVDTLRVPAHVLEFARIDHRLGPREELGSHPDVRPELRVSLNLRPQLGQFVPGGPRLPHPSRLVEDVLDDLLVFDCLDESVVADRLPRVREDRVRATRVQAGGPRVVHLALHVRDEVFRGGFQTGRQPGRHLLRLREFSRNVRVMACVGRGFGPRERLLRPQD